MSRNVLKMLSGIAFLAVVFTVTSRAQQDQWSWPEKPKNLQVLPKDWPGSRLSEKSLKLDPKNEGARENLKKVRNFRKSRNV